MSLELSVLMAGLEPEPLLTYLSIHHRLESCKDSIQGILFGYNQRITPSALPCNLPLLATSIWSQEHQEKREMALNSVP